MVIIVDTFYFVEKVSVKILFFHKNKFGLIFDSIKYVVGVKINLTTEKNCC
jgi:hypothetical protein